jgi:hypothetical protein
MVISSSVVIVTQSPDIAIRPSPADHDRHLPGREAHGPSAVLALPARISRPIVAVFEDLPRAGLLKRP